MRLNPAVVKTLFLTELRMAVRDRRMVLTSILLPLLITPALFLGSTWTMKKRERTLSEINYSYAVTGSQAEVVRNLLEATRARQQQGHGTNDFPPAGKRAGENGKRLRKSAAGPNSQPFRFHEVRCTDPAGALAKGDIHFFVEGLMPEEARQSTAPGKPGGQREGLAVTNSAVSGAGAPGMPSAADPGAPEQNGVTNSTQLARTGEDDGETPIAGATVVRIVFRGDRDESGAGSARMQDALRETRRVRRSDLLQSRGFPVRPAEVAAITDHDVASKQQLAGLALGRSLTLVLLLFILMGGAVMATDSIAGEKERGTLETLLTTAANRVEILAAKHLVILAVALLITFIQALNLLVYIGFKLLPVPPNLSAAVTPPVVALLFLLFLPVAALMANVLLLVSGYARSYKEAQMYFLPVMLLGLLPGVAPFLPGIPLRSIIVLVPVANLAVAAKQILIGSFDWPMICLSWVATASAAVWTARLAVRTLMQEKLITTAESDAVDFAGGPALFERRVLLWFGMLWAVLLLVNNYTQALDVRLQLVINLLGLFFGACVLMIRHYRLHPRLALALRMPRPAIWLGVLLGVPGGLLTSLALFRLASLFLPVPEKMTESFSESLLPKDVSFLQVLFFMTVLPGIFEEVAFRGLLLHGLRRRLHPVGVALVVGVVFGIFHVALFRLAGTAFLGFLFAVVTLLSGSIFPAMLWHCLSNALALLAYKLQIPQNGLDLTCYLTGAGFLAAALWIFWRNRTPYPDLRDTRRFKAAHSSSTFQFRWRRSR